MSQSFAVEFAEGLGATVYLRSALSADDLLELHQTVDRLPSSAKVLRIQLTSEANAGMPGGLSEFVRFWRETRRRPVHLILVPCR
jgi:hypothetical protein